MMLSIKRWVRENIPKPILMFLFPSKFPRFIKIVDEIGGKKFEMYLRSDAWIENEILKNGLYGGWEKISLKLWAHLSRHSAVIVDIGANTGIYSLLAQNNNVSATVIAVEPVDINYEILARNIRKNKFPVNVDKIALSDTEGIATMYMLKDKLNYMTSVNDDRYKLHPEIQGESEVIEIQVPIKPFKYLVDKYNLRALDLVKLDVEGHELAVVNSMKGFLAEHHPSILIEIISDVNAVDLDHFFRGIGYDLFLAIDEKRGVKIVNKLWDNDHANFLVCQKEMLKLIPDHFFVN
jgi:FkbM family methyltransferase